MSVVQQVLVDRLINYLDELVHRGKVKFNGQYVNYDIFKTVKEGKVLRKYIYLETETGYVEEAQLLSSANEILAIKPFSIEKKDDGLVLAFEFTITVQEG
ncbi:hypothetical protein FQ087_18225 [Sporosarcina sp. ANT_H38]|uniref:hypothetical protein n=1 Tax=Sporosarcina sp. ANT_H38 TaxID=2597358 RepID=UPI0011F3B214|nr:hypothetical protein [Sporosarcina sp. ANT_H38]KAA0944063.1 hypothetical protein FQ087_18225 [Sporosarcina sp. ANT_H38]